MTANPLGRALAPLNAQPILFALMLTATLASHLVDWPWSPPAPLALKDVSLWPRIDTVVSILLAVGTVFAWFAHAHVAKRPAGLGVWILVIAIVLTLPAQLVLLNLK